MPSNAILRADDFATKREEGAKAATVDKKATRTIAANMIILS